MARRTLTRVPVLITVTALMLTACGGDDDSDSGAGGLASGCKSPLAPTSGQGIPEIEGLQGCAPDSRDHTEDPVAYTENPPVGGAHFAKWRTCDFYDEEIPAEQGVHSLEHGAVWITYRDNLPGAEQDVLRDVAGDNDFVLVSKDSDLPAPVVASAWGFQVQLEGARDPRLTKFVDFFAEGPQTPEPGAPCHGGVS
jgi:hypothetical protein